MELGPAQLIGVFVFLVVGISLAAILGNEIESLDTLSTISDETFLIVMADSGTNSTTLNHAPIHENSEVIQI